MSIRSRLSSVKDGQFDVAIIGGGINGAAGAQQLAARGYRVVLIEKNDFGSGSSSRSSRLLHCGLRYLAPGGSLLDFVVHPKRLMTGIKMAKAAIEARHELVSTTPNRAKKMLLCFPIYKGDTYSGWHIDAAFKVLQQFNRGKTPLNYRRLKGQELAGLPIIDALQNRQLIDSVAVYDEYQISWPERIVMDAVLDAHRNGATVLNYTKCAILQHISSAWHLQLTDTCSKETVNIRADAIVNAAGIWIDEVFRGLRNDVSPKVLGTKGAHIVVKLPERYRGTGVATINSQHEPFYCLPWGHHHYIGPTETVYDGDKDRIVTTGSDVQFLLDEANRLFPALGLAPRDVIHTWSGVRPLTWDASMPKGNRNRVLHDMSEEGLPNVLALTAGPIMTYRSAGTEIAAAIERILGKKPSGKRLRYRSDAPAPEDSDFIATLTGEHPEPAWLTQIFEDEFVVHLSDIVMRRTGVVWYQALTETNIRKIARHCASRLGWDDMKMEEEVRQCLVDLKILQGTP